MSGPVYVCGAEPGDILQVRHDTQEFFLHNIVSLAQRKGQNLLKTGILTISSHFSLSSLLHFWT